MSPWSWLAAGVALMVVEAFTPGFAALWLGAAAIVTGIIVWLQPGLAWQWQLLAFAVLSVLAVVGWFRLRGRGHAADLGGLNRRAEQQIGAVGVLVGPLVNGHGRVRLGDSTWSAVGPDLPDGTNVRVTAVEQGRLRVTAATGG
jgi:membrane protein implicated in regulation of membrane protease activity